jgi:MFS family permease
VATNPSIALPASSPLAYHARRLVAARLLPFLFILYIVNYIDRTNIAYAALGMSRDLGFSDRVFGLGAGIFFISYVALQVPGSLLVERWSARRMISFTMITWGLLTILTALVRTPLQLYLARFALGAAEAGFFPGVVVYLSHWFIREDRAKASSNFMGAIPLSAVLGSPLAGWLLSQSWFTWQGWRWLFVVEGAPAVLLGACAYFYLTDWPEQAHWLSPEQRHWIDRKLEEERPPSRATATVWQAMRSPIVLYLSSITFLSYLGQYTFVFWFPVMLKRMSGFSDLRVGVLGAIPFLATFVVMQINAWHSDRTAERHWHSAAPLFFAATAYFLLSVPGHSMLLTMTLFTAASLGTSWLPVFWSMPSELLTPAVAATAVGTINAVGNIAGFAAPYAFGYLYTTTGSFATGLRLTTLSIVVAALMVLRIPRSASQSLP